MTTDSYRVILTNFDGSEIPLELQTREAAMEEFDLILSISPEEPWQGKERIRVVSEHEWVMSRLVAGAV